MSEKAVINVSGSVRIVLEPDSWAIQRKRINSKTEDVLWKPIAWYPRLTQALEHCLDDELRKHERVTIEELRDEYTGIERALYAYVDSNQTQDIAGLEHERLKE